jgi:hypothetical protein
MNTYEKLDWIHFALQEAIQGNLGELDRALELVEILREVEYIASRNPAWTT